MMPTAFSRLWVQR